MHDENRQQKIKFIAWFDWKRKFEFPLNIPKDTYTAKLLPCQFQVTLIHLKVPSNFKKKH